MGIHWVIFQPAILVATIGYKHFLGKTTASVETSVVRPWVFKSKGWRAVFFLTLRFFQHLILLELIFFSKHLVRAKQESHPIPTKKRVCVMNWFQCPSFCETEKPVK